MALAWLIHRWMFIPLQVSIARARCEEYGVSLMDHQSAMAMRAVQASIAVVVITLFLFFASGMYEEKIRYAHSYVLPIRPLERESIDAKIYPSLEQSPSTAQHAPQHA
jgi:hypothetical protein